MENNLNELLILNRMILFVKMIAENTTDINTYSIKVEQDLKFIGNRLTFIFGEIEENHELFKTYNKVYCSVLKKYFTISEVILSSSDFVRSKNMDIKGLLFLVKEIKQYYDRIKNGFYTERKVELATQYINENEYTLLLSQLEE